MVLNINSATVLDYGKPKVSIPRADTDGVTNASAPTEWINTNFTEQYGAFKNVSEYQNALLMKGIWNTGKGWTADSHTTVTLKHLTGWGKDTFDDLIFNLDVASMAAGDAFAHIIRDKETGGILNLKPLNPGTIKVVVNPDGRIKEYVQMSRIGGGEPQRTYQPEEIFHLSYNRMFDSIHGISLYDKLKPIILADEKSFEIMQKVMSHQAVPFIIWKFKTDDETKINTIMTKIRRLRELTGDLGIPDDENLLSWEVVQISPAQIIMEWRNDLRNKMYRALGLPQIVPGGGEQGTGSESRTIYLAFEQLVAQRQLYLQNQLEAQLGLKLRFNPPTTMADLIGSNEQKTNEFSAQPSEVNPSAERQ